MDRQIKFRAFVPNEKKMVYGVPVINSRYHHCISSGFALQYDPEYIVLDVMQFTGLLDMDGKEVYEGDLFKIGAEPQTFEVVFKHGCFMAYCNGKQFGLLGELQQCFIKVIGNRFENPELLEL